MMLSTYHSAIVIDLLLKHIVINGSDPSVKVSPYYGEDVKHISQFINNWWDEYNWQHWSVEILDMNIADELDIKCIRWFISVFSKIDISKAHMDVYTYLDLAEILEPDINLYKSRVIISRPFYGGSYKNKDIIDKADHIYKRLRYKINTS